MNEESSLQYCLNSSLLLPIASWTSLRANGFCKPTPLASSVLHLLLKLQFWLNFSLQANFLYLQTFWIRDFNFDFLQGLRAFNYPAESKTFEI